ncbi:hypothetical protein M8818_005301 [Zalaria obscura]|uniref:Uncharacterized protein n=1 Tax=Zalaria obscura TaxID=2024903 RepID=A0ACC3SB67_9PEZI
MATSSFEWYVICNTLLGYDAKQSAVRFIDDTEKTSSWYTFLPKSTYTKPLGPTEAVPQGGLVDSPLTPPYHSHSLSQAFPTELNRNFLSPCSDALLRRHSIRQDHATTANEEYFPVATDTEVIPPLDHIYSPTELRSQDHTALTPPLTAQTIGELGKLQIAEEAYLVRHYILNRAPLLDVCDPLHHFGRTVPELAIGSPLLLNAILAVGGHHLARTSDYDPSVAETYHERCVQLLISLLDSPTTISNEVVAATVLLRNYEQMSSAITGSDYERHLGGTSAFLNSTDTYCPSAGGLRQASFWIFIRQDLDVALSQQCGLKLNLETYAHQMSYNMPSDDWGWANKMVWITAEVVAYSFGCEKTRPRYEELVVKTKMWLEQRPKSFQPLYVGHSRPFSAVYYSQPWHGEYEVCALSQNTANNWLALGMQYYHITMILLAVGDSQRITIGFGNRAARNSLQQEVEHHADMLFGVCTTADEPGASITACNAVSVCAPWLAKRDQQESLIAMLRRVEIEAAWPTRRIALAAMEEWEWDEDDRLLFAHSPQSIRG